MADFEIIQGATSPACAVTLRDVRGMPYDLTTATEVRLVVARNPETATSSLLLDVEMEVDGDPTLGRVQHEWADAAESALPTGEHVAMVEVSLPSAKVDKFGPFTFLVLASVRKV